MLEKEKEKMKYDLQMHAKEIIGGKKHKHYLIYDEDDDINEEDFEDTFTKQKRNREEEEDDEVLINKEKIGKYKQKAHNVEQLKEISKGLQEQKELIPNAKRYKDKNGNYKYFVERKK